MKPKMQTTTLGGTTAAFATNVGIATVDIGTPEVGVVAGELHPKGLALGAASGLTQGSAALGAGAAYGVGLSMAGALLAPQQPERASAATRAGMYRMASDLTPSPPPVAIPSVARHLTRLIQ